MIILELFDLQLDTFPFPSSSGVTNCHMGLPFNMNLFVQRLVAAAKDLKGKVTKAWPHSFPGSKYSTLKGLETWWRLAKGLKMCKILPLVSFLCHAICRNLHAQVHGDLDQMGLVQTTIKSSLIFS